MRKFSGNKYHFNSEYLTNGPNYRKPVMKGGHTHNHVKNAHKRMKKCHTCGKPITKYEGFSSKIIGHICMECRIELCTGCRIKDCREHAVIVGIPTTGSLFNDLRNPYIKWK